MKGNEENIDAQMNTCGKERQVFEELSNALEGDLVRV